MPRGVSIVPRSSTRNRHDVPVDLKSSFFGSPFDDVDQPGHATPRHTRVFDEEGNLTARQVGVHTFHFRRSALFYYVRSQNWVTLLSLSIAIYLFIVAVVTVLYYVWGNMCGADDSVNVIGAIYFTVVSLAANGGYLGEDDDTMANPNDLCYRGRTVLVMACSYVNILFVGIVAALVVSKAESTAKLGNRIVFSTYCALAPVPGRPDQWRLTFRIANVENLKPIANGKLRLFCLSMQPMAEHKREQREQRKLLHLMRRARRAANSPGVGEADGMAVAERLTHDLLRRKRTPEPHGAASRRGGAGAAADLTNASFSQQDPMVKTLLEFKRRKKRETDVVRESRRKRRERRSARRTPTGQGRGEDPLSSDRVAEGHDTESGTTAVAVTGNEADGVKPSTSRTSILDNRSGRVTSAASSSASDSSSSSLSSSDTDDVKSDRTNSSVSDRPAFSPLTASPSGHPPYGSYGTMPASQSMTSLNARTGGGAGARRGKGYERVGARHDDEACWEDVLPQTDAEDWERVFITTQELSWTCAGESYLDNGASGQLGLWYPTAITHYIDERSPLFRFMDVQHVSVGLLQEMVLGADRAAEMRRQQQQEVPQSGSSSHDATALTGAAGSSGSRAKQRATAKRFQLVAVFEATEIETGATITAKHTYDTSDIIANAKFSNKLVRLHKKTREVWLDYHYFNDVLPLLATDSSTTESE